MSSEGDGSMNYLTVGTREITEELFKEVEDTDKDNIKPRGGLWLTKYDQLYGDYNEWVDYMISDPVTLYYKSRNFSMWKQPCSLVTLSDTANIYQLNSQESFDYLKSNYPLDNGKFSYEAISHIYDGIFVDLLGLLRNIEDANLRSRLLKFGVNTLMLFNLKCIDYYQPGFVLIEPFDFEYEAWDGTTYKIDIENTKKRILKKPTIN